MRLLISHLVACACVPAVLAASLPAYFETTPSGNDIDAESAMPDVPAFVAEDPWIHAIMTDLTVLEQDASTDHTTIELGQLPNQLTGSLIFDVDSKTESIGAEGSQLSHTSINGFDLDLAWIRNKEIAQQGAGVLNVTTGVILPTETEIAEHPESIHSITASDTFGIERDVQFAVTGRVTSLAGVTQQALIFTLLSIDGEPVAGRSGFTLIYHFDGAASSGTSSQSRLISIMSNKFGTTSGTLDLPFSPSDLELPAYTADREVVDLEEEIHSLLRLEQQAQDLQTEIAARRQYIAGRLRENRDKTSLGHLICQCDGIMCAAKVIAQRICDKVGISTEPALSYARLGAQQTLSEGANATVDNAWAKAAAEKDGASALPTYRPGVNGTDSAKSNALPTLLANTTPTSPLLHILEIVASALGLVALAAFVHRRFILSPRSRAERLADQEERQNARAYRRAARRAEVKRRWAALLAALNCFGKRAILDEEAQPVRVGAGAAAYESAFHSSSDQDSRRGPFYRLLGRRNDARSSRREQRSRRSGYDRLAQSTSDYEEKRALIVQDAFLEQQADPELAEKGEVMEAEIRELRNAHDIVRNLVMRPSAPGPGPNGAAVLHRLLTRDVLPAIAPLPGQSAPTYDAQQVFTPVSSRSRASSGTLPPSYRSESLPDYDSRPDEDRRVLIRHSRRSSHGSDFDIGSDSARSYSSKDENDRVFSPRPPPSSTSSHVRSGRTPDSSVIETSPRPSRETLRTMQTWGAGSTNVSVGRRSRSCERDF